MKMVQELRVDQDCMVPDHWIALWIRMVVLPVCSQFQLDVTYVTMTHSKNKGLHFRIGIHRPIEPELANLIQFLIGNDRRKVDLDGTRIAAKFDDWNILYELLGTVPETIYQPVRPCQVTGVTFVT